MMAMPLVMASAAPSAMTDIRAGRLRPLAVTTRERSGALPDIPTVSNFLPGYEASAWFGLGAPKNTHGEIVDRLNKEINAGPRRSAPGGWGCFSNL